MQPSCGYEAKSCNFATAEKKLLILFKIVEEHPGITTKELVTFSGMAQRTVYYYIKYFIEQKRNIYKKNGGLYAKGKPPTVVKEWTHHNILVYLLTQYEVGVLANLCKFLNNSELFKGKSRIATPWPKPREWRPIQKSKTIKIKCTDNPLTYQELTELRQLIWNFFKEKKRIRIKCEQNMDTILGSNRNICIGKPMTISEIERFIRWYPKTIKGENILREERLIEGTIEDIEDIVRKQDDQMYIQKLEEQNQKLNRVIRELQKKLYKCHIEKEKLKEENRKLKEKFSDPSPQ